jgi:TonB family protein
VRLGFAILLFAACERADSRTRDDELVGPRPLALDAAVFVDALTVREPDPPPYPPPPPTIVPPTLLEAQRIAGNPMIPPDLAMRDQLQRDGIGRTTASMKLCVNTNGDVTSVTQLKSSRNAAYDQHLKNEIARWKYRPYQVNGKSVPVCTAVTFVVEP